MANWFKKSEEIPQLDPMGDIQQDPMQSPQSRYTFTVEAYVSVPKSENKEAEEEQAEMVLGAVLKSIPPNAAELETAIDNVNIEFVKRFSALEDTNDQLV